MINCTCILFNVSLVSRKYSSHLKSSKSPLKACKISFVRFLIKERSLSSHICLLWHWALVIMVSSGESPNLVTLYDKQGYWQIVKCSFLTHANRYNKSDHEEKKTIWRGFVFSTSSYSKKEIFIKSIWIIQELEKCIIVTKAWNECTPHQCTWNENHKENKQEAHGPHRWPKKTV